jgi:hypothetical protein
MRIDNLLVRLYVTCIAIVTKYSYRLFSLQNYEKTSEVGTSAGLDLVIVTLFSAKLRNNYELRIKNTKYFVPLQKQYDYGKETVL